MNSKLHILPAFTVVLTIGFILAGCTENNTNKKVDHSNLPEEVKPVANAILEDSPTAFASAVTYPVERPYPLPDIKDSVEMVRYYSTLVDDSLKNKVMETPDTLWQQEGWRGWTLDDGSYIWTDEGKAYAINYVSKRETQLLDSLRKEEISSLNVALQGKWTPVSCVIDTVNGSIFRIDMDDVDTPTRYRLAGYTDINNLSGTPALLLYGSLDTEGTMETRYYMFADSVGNSASYSPDIVDANDDLPIIEVRHQKRTKKYRVKPDYWLNHVKRHSDFHQADSLSKK